MPPSVTVSFVAAAFVECVRGVARGDHAPFSAFLRTCTGTDTHSAAVDVIKRAYGDMPARAIAAMNTAVAQKAPAPFVYHFCHMYKRGMFTDESSPEPGDALGGPLDTDFLRAVLTAGLESTVEVPLVMGGDHDALVELVRGVLAMCAKEEELLRDEVRELIRDGGADPELQTRELLRATPHMTTAVLAEYASRLRLPDDLFESLSKYWRAGAARHTVDLSAAARASAGQPVPLADEVARKLAVAQALGARPQPRTSATVVWSEDEGDDDANGEALDGSDDEDSREDGGSDDDYESDFVVDDAGDESDGDYVDGRSAHSAVDSDSDSGEDSDADARARGGPRGYHTATALARRGVHRRTRSRPGEKLVQLPSDYESGDDDAAPRAKKGKKPKSGPAPKAEKKTKKSTRAVVVLSDSDESGDDVTEPGAKRAKTDDSAPPVLPGADDDDASSEDLATQRV